MPDDDLKVYVVWLPILPADNRQQAEDASDMPADPRVRHFWVPDPEVAERFQAAVGLEGEKAWNVYLLYDGDARWGEQVPRPVSFMHQGRKLPDDRVLDARELADEVRAILDSGASGSLAER